MKISVIIPVFNQIEFTLKCLESLARHDPVHEIIVVDNGSTDSTAEQLNILQDAVTVITNDTNRGFAIACNQGAEAATGNILFFLNNDTIVHPGFTRMVLMLENTEVGVVGPKLVYPDLSIQSAGIAVDFDRPLGLEAWNLRIDWTDEPTDVFAVSGAALATRKETFEILGGFDQDYWNGYEDVDFCLTCIFSGYRNIYYPRSVITHFESQSGPERFSAVTANVNRLRRKWETKL
jgi:GT2 family glycosyltransferase